MVTLGAVAAHDDGRYANSPLKSWFEGLRSKDGIQCCADAGNPVARCFMPEA
jgi:hypothetical protein